MALLQIANLGGLVESRPQHHQRTFAALQVIGPFIVVGIDQQNIGSGLPGVPLLKGLL